jgi:mRNA interferase MazF
MTPIEPGSVVLVPFPFTDQTTSKQRPAVVLSGRDYNAFHPDLILAPITSRLVESRDDVILAGWEPAGLAKPSAVKPLLASFDAALVRRLLGNLTPEDLASVHAMFARILELK